MTLIGVNRKFEADYPLKKGGIAAAQPLEGGEGDPTLIAVFVLLVSSCSCVPADAAGVPA